MVLEIIREKDQADFRGVRGDFGARAGGGSIEVCLSCRVVPGQTGRTLVNSLTLTEWALVHLQSQGGCEEGPRESPQPERRGGKGASCTPFRERGRHPGFELCLKAVPAAQVKTRGEAFLVLCIVCVADPEAQLTNEVEWDENLSFIS